MISNPTHIMLVRLFLTKNAMLTSKCYVNLTVEQEYLDQHKSSSLIDINCDVPLADIEGLPDKPPPQESFPTNCFSFEDFFQIF